MKTHCFAPRRAVFLLLVLWPGLLSAQQAAPAAEPEPLTTEGQPKRELRSERLWLLPRNANLADLLERAARQALEHPDCQDVLYGSLNEFRSERGGTSFTILCMRDARSTFNLVFEADDLKSSEELNNPADLRPREELERLRQMMQPVQPASDTTLPPASENSTSDPSLTPADAPVLF